MHCSDFLLGVWIQWNGMADWNGGLDWNGVEWNSNKLDTYDWFSPPYILPLNKDRL